MTLSETEDFVAAKIIALANRCISRKNSFYLVLAGGETPRAVYALLTEMVTDWEKWHIYFGDERCLPAHDKNRNDTMAFDTWLAHVDVPLSQIHSIPAELPQQICVEQYTQTLKNVGNFDLVLLGLGEDGHTASLFPGNDWGDNIDAPDVMAVDNAPKAPACKYLAKRPRGSSKRKARRRTGLYFDLPDINQAKRSCCRCCTGSRGKRARLTGLRNSHLHPCGTCPSTGTCSDRRSRGRNYACACTCRSSP